MGSFRVCADGSDSTTWRNVWVPTELFGWVGRELQSPVFIETGTEHGRTSQEMAGHFQKVITIEASKVHYEKAKKERLGELPNVTQYLANSMDVIPAILSEYAQVWKVWWLDAHFTHAADHWNYAGASEDHPLLEEIDAIAPKPRNVLFIDDMRFCVWPGFTSPKSIQEWPSLRQLFDHLGGYEIALYGDVMCAFPEQIADGLIQGWRRFIKGNPKLDIL